MYNLYGTELDLNEELLKDYSELTIAEPGTDLFDRRLSILAKIALQTDSFEKAVDLYGAAIVAKKIKAAIEEELSTFTIERE